MGLDGNTEIHVRLDCKQVTYDASEDTALEENFTNSEDGIGITEDITIDHEELLEKEICEEQGKNNGKGKGK